tara:strand:+ start:311 stop:427 length:117 start_codon:yes stop_codon:yes gene_type:complete
MTAKIAAGTMYIGDGMVLRSGGSAGPARRTDAMTPVGQ